MINKLLTLCIAAYNAQDYIGDTLKFFLESKYRDELEIIVVNDGSKDNTADIVSKYAIEYSNVIVSINKQNGGSGSARNIAFKEAHGKYLRIIDADDRIDVKELDLYLEELKKSDADMVVNGFYEYNMKNQKSVLKDYFTKMEPNKVYDLNTDNVPIADYYFIHGITYKTELIQKNQFLLSEGMPYVDLEYDSIPVSYVNTIQYIKHSFYIYRIGIEGQSADPEVIIKKGKNIQKIVKRLMDHYHDNLCTMNDNTKAIIRKTIAFACGAAIHVYNVQEKFSMKEEVVNLDQWIKECDIEIWKEVAEASGSVRLMRKLHYFCYYPMIMLHKINRLKKG